MKVYDISQEVFSCEVYPGDPIPEKNVLKSMQKGEVYNLTAFSMCAHNGTHIDAPFHFIRDGKTVDEICLEAFVGMAYVAEHNGIVTGNDATEIIEKAKKRSFLIPFAPFLSIELPRRAVTRQSAPRRPACGEGGADKLPRHWFLWRFRQEARSFPPQSQGGGDFHTKGQTALLPCG